MRAYAAFKDGEINWHTIRRYDVHVLEHWQKVVSDSWATLRERMNDEGYEIREIEITWDGENEEAKEESQA